ncbi:amidase [Pararhodobacter sp.]|uniref:amidase n=1 Tax=Pararhodobacter sp. TaxID=2127056 RepID=UPI002FDDC96D
METISELARQLEAGETTALALATACMERILDPAGEGARAFTMIDPDRSFAQARLSDEARARGEALPPLAGIPLSVKALFDIEGKVTHAGSRVLAKAPPARSDATSVARLRAAGAVVMGHTNMTEFAYSGLGMNPHYGTPGNPADRSRIPGGSTSGGAVSVADGMAAGALGTDTGGSCRIPAAFCGMTGFKPTARRIPAQGTFPLSVTLDSIGSVARSVECVALLDAVLAGEPVPAPEATDLAGLTFAVLENYVTDGIDAEVAAAYEAALATLTAAGAHLVPLHLPDLGRLPELNARGGIVAAEALAVHRDMLDSLGALYDPRVASRILKGETQMPGELAALLAERQAMITRADAATAPFAAVLMPTVPITAPRIADLDADEALYGKINLLCLRNPTVANLLDRCAISLPLPVDGLPVGLSLMGETLQDRVLLAVARGVEKALARA